MKSFFSIAWKILRSLVLGVSLILLLASWALRTSWFQDLIQAPVESLLSDALGTQVQIGEIDLDLPAHLIIRNAILEDPKGQTLLGVAEIRADMAYVPIMELAFTPGTKKKIDVGHLDLFGPEFFIYRSRADSSLNIDFLSSSTPDTTEASPLMLDISLQEGRIRGGQFTYIDSTKSDERLAFNERLNFDHLRLTDLSMDFSYGLRGEEMIMQGDIEDFRVMEAHSGTQVKELHSGYYLEAGDEAPGGFLLCLDDTRLNLRDSTRLFFNGDITNELPDSVSTGFSPKIALNFLHSYVHMGDINSFLEKPIPLEGPAFIEGYLYGTMDHLFSDDLYLGIQDTTRLHTTLVLNNLSKPEELNFDLNLSPSLVSFRELENFLTGVDLPLAGVARVDGEVIGDLNRLTSKDLHLRYGDYTDLHVRTRVFDYQEEPNMHMDLKLIKSKVDVAELLTLLPDLSLPAELQNIGRAQVNGRFIGGTRDFAINADIGTDHGLVDANMRFQMPRGGQMSYDGRLRTSNLDFDAIQLAPQKITSNLNFEGTVKGTGTDFYTMRTEIGGKLTDTDLMGYQVDLLEAKDIIVDRGSIKGDIEVLDREGDASFTIVNVSLPKSAPDTIVVSGDFKALDLDHYDILAGDSVFLSSIVTLRLTGDSIENYTGRVLFSQNQLNREDADSLELKRFYLKSEVSPDGQRNIRLKSGFATMHLTGKFLYSEAAAVAGRLSQELDLYIRNNDSLITAYYAEKKPVEHILAIADTLETKDKLNDLFAFLRVPVYAEPASRIILNLEHSAIEDLVRLRMLSDSLNIASIGLLKDSMDIDLTKEATLNKLLLTGYFGASTFWPSKGVKVEEFVVLPQGDDKELNVHIHGTQSEFGNLYVLNLQNLFLPNDEIRTKLTRGSKLRIQGNEWKFKESNLITRRREFPPAGSDLPPDTLIDRFYVSDLSLFLLDSNILSSGFARVDTELISINGIVSKSKKDFLVASISNLNIVDLLGVSEQETGLRGYIPEAELTASSIMSEQPIVSLSAFVRELGYQEIDSLEIDFLGGWPAAEGNDYAGFIFELREPNGDNLKSQGSYHLPDEGLNIIVEPSTFNLELLQPFLSGTVSDLKGHLSLEKTFIKGTVPSPKIDGEVHFSDASMKVDFLNNRFRLGDNSLFFDFEQLTLPKIQVFDDYGKSAELHGIIDYNNSAGVFLDLMLDQIDSLTVMDTRREHSSDFYGRVILDGDSANIEGLVDLIRVDASLKTAKGSWLDIPLDDFTSANRLDFVTFVGAEKDIEIVQESSYEGFSLLANVQATPDARLRLILDEQVGDIIEAKGEGNITMQISETGEFQMYGTYLLTDGNYLFTAENIVNKKFTVRPGGRISFSGDPYNAELDLYAVYNVNADVSDLLGGASNRVPVDILMHMQGSLEDPQIELSLKLDELNQQDVLGLSSYFRRIEYDEQELNKQVVSLLLFGRFSGSNIASNASPVGGVTSSISELISNQVNYWISQAFSDANLGVEVNTNEFQDVELAVRTTLFNDRITVERNGTLISNQGNGLTIGDLSVQVRLLPRVDQNNVARPDAGRLVLEIFNREDVTLTSAANVTRGAGIFYKKDFDRIGDLFKKSKTPEDLGEDIPVDESENGTENSGIEDGSGIEPTPEEGSDVPRNNGSSDDGVTPNEGTKDAGDIDGTDDGNGSGDGNSED